MSIILSARILFPFVLFVCWMKYVQLFVLDLSAGEVQAEHTEWRALNKGVLLQGFVVFLQQCLYLFYSFYLILIK